MRALHQDLSGSFQLGILPLMQKELIRRIAWLNNRRIRSWKCISINSLIHSGTCAACQETFLQIHLCQMNRRHLFLRNVYAEVPAVHMVNPCCRVRGKTAARFDEPNKETQSFTIPDPRFARNMPTVNLPSSAQEVYPHLFMVGQRKNHISELQFEKFPTPPTF